MGQPIVRLLRYLLLLQAAVSSGSLPEGRHRLFRPQPGERVDQIIPNNVDSTGSWRGPTDSQPIRFFEVARPVIVPEGVTPCSVLLLEHSFAFTYGQPPAEAAFRPPNCGSKWDKVVLKWTGTCKGRQFDRIAAVWLNGVEIFRTCTAEPVAQGIVWEVEKDVTRYSSLFQEPGELVVSLANVVDNTYTGTFNIAVEAVFYPSSTGSSQLRLSVSGASAESSVDVTGFSKVADLILPVTQLPHVLGDGGYLQRIENASHTVSVTLDSIPKNVYRAVLEVCVSFHERDEFWYTNAPNIWIEANNISGYPGNGPHREVVASLDGKTVGAVWPFPVIYTGGLNPYLWRPAAAIGAFDLPSYDIEITPFVGSIVDGQNHTFSFSVTNALNVWFVQGNLHLWLDAESHQTSGGLEGYSAPASSHKLNTHGYKGGLDASFTTSASRSISYSGYVRSSHGKVISAANYQYRFKNKMVFARRAATQTIHQDTSMHSRVVVKTEWKDLVNSRHLLSFPFRLNYDESDEAADKSVSISVNLTHRLEEHAVVNMPSFRGATWSDSLSNSQTVSGLLVIYPNNTNTGRAESSQTYDFESTDVCYSRNVVTRNYAVLTDDVNNQCKSSVTW